MDPFGSPREHFPLDYERSRVGDLTPWPGDINATRSRIQRIPDNQLVRTHNHRGLRACADPPQALRDAKGSILDALAPGRSTVATSTGPPAMVVANQPTLHLAASDVVEQRLAGKCNGRLPGAERQPDGLKRTGEARVNAGVNLKAFKRARKSPCLLCAARAERHRDGWIAVDGPGNIVRGLGVAGKNKQLHISETLSWMRIPIRSLPYAACEAPNRPGDSVPMSTMKERMLRGELYEPEDAELAADHAKAQALLERYNHSGHNEQDERQQLLGKLLGKTGKGVVIKPPFHCDYGTQISIGVNTFINYDCVMLDVAPISIGAACQFASRVQLLTGTHPIDPVPRKAGWAYGEPIAIADNVWLGGGVTVCPGITIGEDTVVGAGSLVTRDLPSGVVAFGVPASVQREISEQDRIAPPNQLMP